MRRVLCMILVLLLAISMAACAQNNEDNPPESTPTASTVPSVGPLPDVPLETVYSVCVPHATQYHYSGDGALLFSYSTQHMQLSVPDQVVSDKITLDFLNRVDSTAATAETIKAQAELDYLSNENWMPYEYRVSYSPMRIDKGILSLFAVSISMTGTQHPGKSGLSASYDMATGEVLTLGSILTHIDQKPTLCQLVLDELDSADYLYSLYDGYEDVIKERFSQDESHDEAFYFTNKGLCFYFAPYEIAPYASGIISIEVPYSKLTGVLSDAFFPDEVLPSTGDLIAQRIVEAPEEDFLQLSEVAFDTTGEKILLYAQHPVRNLRIARGSWTPDGLYFIPEYTIFAATGVTGDRATIIQTLIPDVLPDLVVSYQAQNGEKQFYISQSGDTGDILLLPVE